MIGPKVIMKLQRETAVSDDMGGYTISLEDKGNITGALSTVRGDERLSADKLTVIASHYFYVYYSIGKTITEEDIFHYGTRIFKIIHIYNMGLNQNRILRITLKEEV